MNSSLLVSLFLEGRERQWKLRIPNTPWERLTEVRGCVEEAAPAPRVCTGPTGRAWNRGGSFKVKGQKIVSKTMEHSHHSSSTQGPPPSVLSRVPKL